jgi:hydroxymethylpyrimidine kinase/phosphomethylpyrimidine kinase
MDVPFVPNVLSIAGSDPSGGAGIQADLKTFSALGVYGMAVPTALTVQNTLSVSAVHAVPGDLVRAQLDAVFADVRVDAVKIGMLGSAQVARAVSEALRRAAPPFIVFDPVLRASTGGDLLDRDALDIVREELLPLATVITPNADEATELLGRDAVRTPMEARAAATTLVARGARAALVTGGHLDGDDDVVDVLDVLCDGSSIREFRVAREHGTGTHGTGCTLSSAIAALLARGLELDRACAAAQAFVAAAIANGRNLEVGRGRGPVHQLGAMWSAAGGVEPEPRDSRTSRAERR